MAGRSIVSKALARQPSSFLNGRLLRSTSSSPMAALSSAEREELTITQPRQDPSLDQSTLFSTAALSRGLCGRAASTAVP